MTQGKVEYESTVPWGTDEGLDLWEAGYLRRPITSIRVLVVASKETNLLKHNHGELESHVVLSKKRWYILADCSEIFLMSIQYIQFHEALFMCFFSYLLHADELC
jgi:hypothetical protein